MFTDAELAKLPKWALYKVQRLKADLKDAEDRCAALEGNGPIKLRSARSVDFHLKGNGGVTVDIIGDQLSVYGNGPLQLMPRAANSVWIKVE